MDIIISIHFKHKDYPQSTDLLRGQWPMEQQLFFVVVVVSVCSFIAMSAGCVSTFRNFSHQVATIYQEVKI